MQVGNVLACGFASEPRALCPPGLGSPLRALGPSEMLVGSWAGLLTAPGLHLLSTQEVFPFAECALGTSGSSRPCWGGPSAPCRQAARLWGGHSPQCACPGAVPGWSTLAPLSGLSARVPLPPAPTCAWRTRNRVMNTSDKIALESSIRKDHQEVGLTLKKGVGGAGLGASASGQFHEGDERCGWGLRPGQPAGSGAAASARGPFCARPAFSPLRSV